MELLGLLAVILAIVALTNASSAHRRIEQLERALREVNNELANIAAALRGERPPVPPPPQQAPIHQPPPVQRPQHVPAYQPKPVPEPSAAAEALASSPPPPPPPQDAPAPKSLEEALTSRWLVWVGAVTIALAGTFLVRYAIDQGYLGPTARVTFGFLLGLVLAAAGEWLRRRPMERAIAAIRVNHVPPALTASGLFTAFASIYAAYGLYHLLPPLVAFAGLAFVALAAIGLSLLQGRFVAGMGLLGAFAAPALVTSEHPSAWTLFAYILVVEAACLVVARTQRWWWLAAATLAGAVIWPFLWMVSGGFNPFDGMPLGLFLLATAAFFLALRRGLPEPETRRDWLEELAQFGMAEFVVWAGAAATALSMFVVTRMADYGPAVLVLSGAMMALNIAAGRRHAIFDSLPVVAAALALLIALTMPLPPVIAPFAPFHNAPVVPFELQYFATTTTVFGALFALSGFVLLWGAKRPALWAGVSAGVPLALLVIAYGRIADFGVDLSWAGMALALAAVNLFAAERVERYRAARGLEMTLAFYAASVVALISLAAAMSLREAWLTVALSLQLPALAWIHTRLQTRSLQVIAAAVAITVLVRLAFNYYVLDYPVGPDLSSNWLLYGYGVPALSFFAAAHVFRGRNAGNLVALLEAGALAFAVLLTSLEIRLFVTGALTTPSYGLVEESVQTIAWLAIGSALAVHWRRTGNAVSMWGACALIGAGAAQIVLLQLLFSNPLWTPSDVGRYPLVNVLLLAYAVPACFAFFAARVVENTRFGHLARFVGGAGFALVFAWLSLEVTHAFEGPVFHPETRSAAELYAYSLLWLAYAVVLLVLGIARRQSFLRYASLAVLIVTTLKVFLIDMAGLTGLYRVGSFLGLGLSLIGIGYIYQRFVFPRPEAPRA